MATLRQAQDERGGEETRQGAEGGAGGPRPEADAQDRRVPATRVRAGALAAALKDVVGAAGGGGAIPILNCVSIVAQDNRIELTATDLDLWASRTVSADVEGQPDSPDWKRGHRGFALALPAAPLAAVLGEIDAAAMLTIAAPHGEETRALIKAGRVRVKLACLPAEDFPVVPATPHAAGFALACAALADHFARVEHAISTEETRYYLNGVFVHAHQVDGEARQLRLAATDGHRLARLSIDAPAGAEDWPDVIVARLTVKLLDGLLARAVKVNPDAMVDVSLAGRKAGALVRFALPAGDAESGGRVELIAKTIDGTFPDYARVIPANPAQRAVLDRAALAAAVKRVSVLAAASSRAVVAEFQPGRLTLTARSAELGEAVEELPCAYDGPEIRLGFDGKYWREALAAVATDEVELRFGGDDSDARAPCRIEPFDGAQGERDREPALVQVLVQVLMPVLMPVRV